MSSELVNIIYLRHDKYTWMRLMLYLMGIVIPIVISSPSKFTLVECFLFIGLMAGVLIIALDDIFSKAGVEFIDDHFIIYSYPLFDDSCISDAYPLMEFKTVYSTPTTSLFCLRDGTEIRVNINKMKASRLHAMLVERQVQMLLNEPISLKSS